MNELIYNIILHSKFIIVKEAVKNTHFIKKYTLMSVYCAQPFVLGCGIDSVNLCKTKIIFITHEYLIVTARPCCLTNIHLNQEPRKHT